MQLSLNIHVFYKCDNSQNYYCEYYFQLSCHVQGVFASALIYCYISSADVAGGALTRILGSCVKIHLRKHHSNSMVPLQLCSGTNWAGLKYYYKANKK